MSQVEELRLWRKQAIESHMYTTAELVGDKILAMTFHHEDAYWLAQTYYGMGEYVRGAHVILQNNYEKESGKCRFIAALCFIRASELDKAHDLLSDIESQNGGTNSMSLPINVNQSHHHRANSGLQDQLVQTPLIIPKNAASIASSPIAPKRASSGASMLPPLNHPKVRVVSTSSIKTPRQRSLRNQRQFSNQSRQLSGTNRQFSGSSRASMILPELGDVSVQESTNYGECDEEINGVFLESLLVFLLGQIYTLESRLEMAKEKYIAALKIDARCFEAFSQLVKYHSLLPHEEWELLSNLNFSRIGSDFGKSIYALRLSTLSNNLDLTDSIENLLETYQIPPENSDILGSKAEMAFASGDFTVARKIFECILKRDPYNTRICPSLAATYYELQQVNELHRLAHDLSLSAPDTPVSSYVIGVYYLANKKCPQARKHFSQASVNDPGFVPAWLGFAKTFAEECEHGQAIAAYSAVTKLFPGYHLPFVYIGIQHLHIQNLGLAEKYLVTASNMFDEDPLLLNELGVVYYQKNELVRARTALELALSVSSKMENSMNIRTSVLTNLGFVARRMDNVPQAIQYFDKVCHETKLDPDVLSALGLCYIQIKDYDKAISVLTQSLSIVRDDPVTEELFSRAFTLRNERTCAEFIESDVKKFMKRNRLTLPNNGSV